MIIIVAPYSPIGRTHNPHLGASRKIEAVIDVLGRFEEKMMLINTAHNSLDPAPLTVDDRNICGVSLVEVSLQTYSNRRIGKFYNLFDVKKIADRVDCFGVPKLVWLYNGYAMESLLGSELHLRSGCDLFIEMEDWHYSRGRGLNPKPFMDWFFWRNAATIATHVFAVNQSMASKVLPYNSNISLFPGIVSDSIFELRKRRQPFSFEEECVTVGYFGGLSVEKGADRVLSLGRQLPEKYKLIVSGAGPLEDEFVRLSVEFPDSVSFYGKVSDMRLNELLEKADVILNPHSSIQNMSNGVFPFKVIEAVASGRLLISTYLPQNELTDVLQGVRFIDDEPESLLKAVVSSSDWFHSNEGKILAGADVAAERYSRASFFDFVASKMRKND